MTERAERRPRHLATPRLPRTFPAPSAGLLCGALVLLATLVPGASGQVYRWTDEEGRVHYGDRPPQGVEPDRSVEIPGAGAPGADGSDRAAPSRGGDPGEERRHRRRKVLEALEAERREREEARAEARRKRAERRRQCRQLSARLARMRNARYLYRKGTGGERQVLSEEERRRYVRSLEARRARLCRS